MKRCPSCGHENADTAERCAQCGRPLAPTPAPSLSAEETRTPTAESALTALPSPPPPIEPIRAAQLPPMPPTPLRPRQSQLSSGDKAGQYFLGIGLGFSPVIVAYLIGIFSTRIDFGALGSLLPALMFLADFIYMIYAFTQERRRWIGYGLLTVIVILPVVLAIACVVILTNAHF